jgi:Chitinase class I
MGRAAAGNVAPMVRTSWLMSRRPAAVLLWGFAVGLGAAATGCSGGAPTAPAGGGSGGAASGTGSGGAAPGSGGTPGAGSGGTHGSGGAVGSGGAGDAGTTDGPVEVALPLCQYPDWKAGTPYNAGDIVIYMGKPYIATDANNGLDPTISTFFWSPYAGCTPMPPAPAQPCLALDRLAPAGQTAFQATYDAMFAAPFQGRVIDPAYTYAGLCQALSTPSLATFAHSNNLLQDRREIAAFFANVAIETAYLAYVDEGNMPASQQNYHGRGSLQITGQAIYQDVGAGLGLNLVAQPQLASTAPVVWQTGLWYWTLHTNPNVGTNCHQAIAAGAFGRTVLIIKGDCASAPDRAQQYQKNCQLLGIDPGNVACP